ncbi:esterase FE4 [Microplitis demolitor]|uniref:esterase FE4 n=1 Tax=Microplitis demolitor TaxID=69319 RepID=UPI0004CD760A|nr:esterase FE4 [Microplitis demolitor]
MNFVSVIYFLIAFACTTKALDDPIVRTSFGPVLGKWMSSHWGYRIAGFLGIPYAQPPLGSLRFERPQPWHQSWTKLRDATVDGPQCPQLNDDGIVVGDEDCLHLNVFVPENASSEKLPVMVFVHGGSFVTGSNNSTLLAPSYLLDRKLILVTVNYRLGILGFLSSGNEASPGNYGIKDVLEALKWIQGNIENFGGDPSSVTLSGVSAGASIAHHLGLSQRTEGLFDKLITHSGVASAPWGIHPTHHAKTRYTFVALAAQLGCGPVRKITDFDYAFGEWKANETITGDDKDIIKCLRRMSSERITQQLSFFQVWHKNSYCNFGPTVESDSEGAIVVRHPLSTIKQGKFRDIPWIVGVVSDEGLLKSMSLLTDEQLLHEFKTKFGDVISLYLETEEIVMNTTKFATELINFYSLFDDNISDEEFTSNLTAMTGDGLMNYWIYEALNAQAPKMKSNVFFYEFAYEGTYTSTYAYQYPQRYGIDHTDDLNYLFPINNVKFADLQLHNTAKDETMINIMVEMWTNFVKDGIPSARLTPDWEPYREDFRFMKIGMGRSPDISMKEGFLPIRMKFWRNLMSSVTAPMELIFPPQKNDDKNNGNDHYASAASQSYPNLLHPCLILSIVNLIYIFCS